MMMTDSTKDGFILAGKGVGLATIGATSQTLTAIGASMFWQVPIVLGFGYLTYSSGRQIYRFFKNN
jgi:hypothetical protein